jgi:hypothetical protein
MFKPARIDTEWIRTIDPGLEARECILCLKKDARWIVGTPETAEAWCSYCFLYETDWGRRNATSIAGLIQAVEKDTRQTISADGRVLPEHAHRILGAIVTGSRAMILMKMKAQQ